MEIQKNARASIEALTFTELLALADEYGIDVPENLDRVFLISEIVDSMAERADFRDEELPVETAAPDGVAGPLPDMYNMTEIEVLLQNPVWAFVFWNISTAEQEALVQDAPYALFLRVCSYCSATAKDVCDVFDVQIAEGCKEQYVLFPARSAFVAVELCAHTARQDKLLAVSNRVMRPYAPVLSSFTQPGEELALSPIMELSGARTLLRKRYLSHRQLFS
ncbi:MAG: DUF4912 domain-containing protein [Treponema sp.]|nr:DUF4912 domain-containing protein [Treponema sp.]